MPNTQMLSKKLSNNSAHPLTAVKVVLGIAYQESIDVARSALMKIIEGDPRICATPQPSVGVTECTPTSVQLALSFWITDETLEAALKLEYLEKAKKALDAAAIEPTAATPVEVSAAAAPDAATDAAPERAPEQAPPERAVPAATAARALPPPREIRAAA